MGIGIGFCVEPALRSLPGGPDGPRYREALARRMPLLQRASVSRLRRGRGAGARRARRCSGGPHRAIPDRALRSARERRRPARVGGMAPGVLAPGPCRIRAGRRPVRVVATFLVAYNAGHLALRIWGLHAGWKHSMRVATALSCARVPRRAGVPRPRRARCWPASRFRWRWHGSSVRGSRTVAGRRGRACDGDRQRELVRMHGRAEGWRIALGVLAAFVLFATVIRHG